MQPDSSYDDVLDAMFPNQPSELVIGLVGALGTDWRKIKRKIEERLRTYGYETYHIHISRDVIPSIVSEYSLDADFDESDLEGPTAPSSPQYVAARRKQWYGNEIRRVAGFSGVLAMRACENMRAYRTAHSSRSEKRAYVICSFKHPAEVGLFRHVYGRGFYLFGVSTPDERRLHNLARTGEQMSMEEAKDLIRRDEDEGLFGQHTRDSFHLADFFIADENNEEKLEFSLWRYLDLIFGHPFKTPTFSEYAMFSAFASALRSGCLSRQVGAVVARGDEILALGANEVPRAGGGQYWPIFVENQIDDVPDGRDYTLKRDSSACEREDLIADIAELFPDAMKDEVVEKLRASRLRDITEYGRTVHAEMDAILSCARRGISCKGATMYVTTFPCHNCAKHIVASGISDVVFVEPYPKSRALDLHCDAVMMKKEDQEKKGEQKVRFKPFIGVGPRQFFNVFSLSLGAGRTLKRKKRGSLRGEPEDWVERDALPRTPMQDVTYLEFEDLVHNELGRRGMAQDSEAEDHRAD